LTSSPLSPTPTEPLLPPPPRLDCCKGCLRHLPKRSCCYCQDLFAAKAVYAWCRHYQDLLAAKAVSDGCRHRQDLIAVKAVYDGCPSPTQTELLLAAKAVYAGCRHYQDLLAAKAVNAGCPMLDKPVPSDATRLTLQYSCR
jgi:hypothetical protein